MGLHETDKLMSILISATGDKEITIDDADEDFQNLGISSIALVSVILAIEEEYNITFPDEYLDLEKINTLNKLSNVLMEIETQSKISKEL